MHLKSIVTHGYKAAAVEPLQCELPGRFSVLAGPNAGGKSTIVDSVLLSHRDVFPFAPRPPAGALVRGLAAPTVEIAYDLGVEPSPLGDLLGTLGETPQWTTSLSPSMGRIVATPDHRIPPGQLPILYLSPTRNPLNELGGRDARLIVELLKAEALRTRGSRSLGELRGRLGTLVSSITATWPVADAEDRVAEHLGQLTNGVAGRIPYLGTTNVDDTFLARVFEFLIGAADATRSEALRVEVDGLGYANLLQLAVVLAAIPDLTTVEVSTNDDEPEPTAEETSGEPAEASSDDLTDEQREDLIRLAEENRRLEDDSIFAGRFHATIILEEPEAHLHTQLQHGLVAYLKEVVAQRPELQIVITTHSDQIVGACEPDDLVVFTRSSGVPRAHTIAGFDLEAKERKQARRHLDTSRSASLFADRLVLVEGQTDAVVLRAFARVWAGDDRVKQRFVDSLTITVIGSRVGRWLPKLLTQPGTEIATRLAVLADTDDKPEPAWITEHRSERFDVFFNEPTLEPAIVEGNEELVKKAFTVMMVTGGARPWEDDALPTPAAIGDWFKERGRRRKADFADALSEMLYQHGDSLVTVPEHLSALLEFVSDGIAASPDGTE